MKARCRNSLILNNAWVERNTVIDDQLVPEKLRATLLDYEDLSERGGKVMVLHETRYQEKRMLNGQPAWLPTTIRAGELVERELLPAACQEGIDFVTDWDKRMRVKARDEEEDREQKLLQPSEPLAYDPMTGWKAK
jgi:hypothetical protein